MSNFQATEREHRRRTALADFSFDPAVSEVLLAALTRELPDTFVPVKRALLGSEPFVLHWLSLLKATRQRGVSTVLEEALFELTFPVAAGAGKSAAYQALSLPGWGSKIPERTASESQAPAWGNPLELRLSLCETAGGILPVIETPSRQDFVRLVQSIIHRNEPVAVPDAIGSFLVMGYTNREVYQDMRDSVKRGLMAPEACDPRLWNEKFLLLSSGNYSGASAAELGFAEEAWPEISRKIRLEHEGCHYLIRRLFPRMAFGLQDELIADLAGLMGAVGEFRAAWFLRFMGIGSNGIESPTGRFSYYQASLHAHAQASKAAAQLLTAAAHNVEKVFSAWDFARWMQQRHEVLPALTWLSLEEIAAPNFAETFAMLSDSFTDE